jgi:ferritin-like metal-binding protein YciE
VPLTNAYEVFLHALGDIHDAERRFLEGQREMVQKATDQNLKNAIQNHIGQTEQQIGNLEQAFVELGEEPHREPCEASQGLVEEAQHDIEEAQTDTARDALIDTAVAKVEHYEIANYRGLITGARLMGHTQVVNLLEKNLRQEEEMAQIAENSAEELLRKASQEQGGQDEGPKVSVH